MDTSELAQSYVLFGARDHSHGHTKLPIHDPPNRHAWIVVGNETLFLCHVIMGWMQGHNYEVVLEVSVPKQTREEIKEAQAEGKTLILGNQPRPGGSALQEYQLHSIPDLQSGKVIESSKSHHFLAEIWDYFPKTPAGMNWPYPDHSSRLRDVKVTVHRVVYYRHMNLNLTSQRYESYVLFGKNAEAHLYHTVVRQPDYDHVATLASRPDWLQDAQIEAGMLISIPALPWSPDTTHCEAPFEDDSEHDVLYHGIESYRDMPGGKGPDPKEVPKLTIRVDRTEWFSTRVVNYPGQSPCGDLGDVPTPEDHPNQHTGRGGSHE